MRIIIGIRGATTCELNSRQAILDATTELLQELISRNGLRTEDLVSIIFTGTPDITAAFPAQAARALGLVDVPLMGAQELAVDGAPGLCIRVLMHVDIKRRRDEVKHIYLRGAKVLRPDLAAGGHNHDEKN